jgi:agmatinase
MSENWPKFKQKIESCCCPPGNGVYTVNTAKERKEVLHKAIYGQLDDVEGLWKSSLDNLPKQSNAVILGISSDCGGGILRGANWGPLFLRNAIREHHGEMPAFDMGDIRVIPHLLHDKYLNQPTIDNCKKALYEDSATKLHVSPLSITEDVARDFYETFPEKGLFGIGGDHSVSYPLTKAYLQAKNSHGIRTAIIHFDAHTDLMVERLGIDLCFGSWCTHILDDLHAPSDLIQIGIRSSGQPKQHWEDKFGVKQFWADEVLEAGAKSIAETILAQLKKDGINELYVSFDIDAIDSSVASATGTPEPDGLMPEDALVILKMLAAEYSITGADMMEIAPFLNTSIGEPQGSEKTLKAGADISAFLINEMAKE